MMSQEHGYSVICTYYVQRGKEPEFEKLLDSHWPTLRRLGLVTDVPAQVYRGVTEQGTYFVEVLTWVRADAAQDAYATDEIRSIWGPMYDMTEDRNGRPAIEYPHVERVVFPWSE